MKRLYVKSCVCDKVVFVREILCDKVVCEKWCVTMLRVDKLCVCVEEGVCGKDGV